MKRPKFAVRFSCEHVNAGGVALFELGAISPGRVDLHRCCARSECVARVVDAIGRYHVAHNAGAVLSRDEAAPVPVSWLRGLANRVIGRLLRLLVIR